MFDKILDVFLSFVVFLLVAAGTLVTILVMIAAPIIIIPVILFLVIYAAVSQRHDTPTAD